MWRLPNDNSKAVITADEQIHSAHRECYLCLPKTAIVFFMSKGTDYLIEHYNAVEMNELFPRFLDRCPIWEIKDFQVCFLDGGRGAPQAADTIETLAALGAKTLLQLECLVLLMKGFMLAKLSRLKKHSLKKEHPFTTMNPLTLPFRTTICLT